MKGETLQDEKERLEVALEATEKQLQYASAHVETLEESIEVLAKQCEDQEKRSAVEAAVASAAEKEALRCQKLLQRKEIEIDVWKGDLRKLETELKRERCFRGRDQTYVLQNKELRDEVGVLHEKLAKSIANAREAWRLTESKSKEAKAYISAVQSYEQVLSASEEREQEREFQLADLSQTVSGLSEALMRKTEDNVRWQAKCKSLEQELARARNSLSLVAARTSEREALSSRPASAAPPAIRCSEGRNCRPESASSTLADVARALRSGGADSIEDRSALFDGVPTLHKRPQTAVLLRRSPATPSRGTQRRPRPYSSAGIRRLGGLQSSARGRKMKKPKKRNSQTRLRPLSGTNDTARAVRHSHVGMLLKLAGRTHGGRGMHRRRPNSSSLTSPSIFSSSSATIRALAVDPRSGHRSRPVSAIGRRTHGRARSALDFHTRSCEGSIRAKRTCVERKVLFSTKTCIECALISYRNPNQNLSESAFESPRLLKLEPEPEVARNDEAINHHKVNSRVPRPQSAIATVSPSSKQQRMGSKTKSSNRKSRPQSASPSFKRGAQHSQTPGGRETVLKARMGSKRSHNGRRPSSSHRSSQAGSHRVSLTCGRPASSPSRSTKSGVRQRCGRPWVDALSGDGAETEAQEEPLSSQRVVEMPREQERAAPRSVFTNKATPASKNISSLFLGHGLGLRKSPSLWADVSGRSRGTVRMMLHEILRKKSAAEGQNHGGR